MYRNDIPRTVALYGRVSTEHEAQISAFNNQEQWLDNLLERHQEWTLYDKYLDEGVTGTQAYKRDGFLRMMDDAQKGTFDLIVARDVCRFARNTMDTLKYTRLLKEIGVEVYFVDDGIWTFDTDGEYRLTLMSANAQDESRRTSVRVKNGQDISRKKAVIYGNGNILGYDRNPITKEFVINEEQANTVRMIFAMYTEGKGLRAIQYELEKLGRLTSTNQKNWSPSVVSRILQNTTYIGYMTYQQSVSNNFLEQKRIHNYDEKELVKIQIEPIIDFEKFQLAQQIRENKVACQRAKGNRGKKPALDIYCRKMICQCGSTFNRRKWHVSSTNEPQWGYHCYSQLTTGTVQTRKNKGLSTDGICQSKMMTKWKLDLMAIKVFSKITMDKHAILTIAEEAIRKHINAKEDTKNSTVVVSLERELTKKNRMLDNLVEMRMEGEIDKQVFLEKKKYLEQQISGLKDELSLHDVANLEEEVESMQERLQTIHVMLEQKLSFEESEDVSDELIEAYVDKIVVCKDRCDWHLKFEPDPIPVTTNNRKKKNGNAYIIEERELSVCSMPLKQHLTTNN